MIYLFSKKFWDEVKCVVEPNSLDLKNLNSKLYALVFTVLKVGYKHDLLIFEIFGNEAKCVVEPNSLDFKNLNSKLSVLVFTVLKVGYKHLSTNQVGLLHNNKK